MTEEERAARQFCQAKGIDPDELRDTVVKRKDHMMSSVRYERGTKQPAWKQYVQVAKET